MAAACEWQARASEALVLAGRAPGATERELLVEIAFAYDRLAHEARRARIIPSIERPEQHRG
jgi:hypothetical protein